MRKEIISTIAGEGSEDGITVTSVDDFVKSDSSSENSMDGSYIALGSRFKVLIFKKFFFSLFFFYYL